MDDLSNLDLSGIAVEQHRVITCTVEGIVDEDDLRMLAGGREVVAAEAVAAGTPPPAEVEDPSDLKRLREKHHSVARQIAAGTPQSLVATICGYTESYLSILLNSPAMQELVAMYRMQQGAAAEVISEKLRTVGMKALEKLDAQMDSTEGLDAQALLGVAKLGLDRSGHGPSSTQRNINENHQIDHAALAEQMRRARGADRELIVPVAEVRAVLEHRGDDAAKDAG